MARWRLDGLVSRMIPRCFFTPRLRIRASTFVRWKASTGSTLFMATDRFLAAIVERNVVMVYVTLFTIFFSETGLVVMAFLPGDSLLFVAGVVASPPALEPRA